MESKLKIFSSYLFESFLESFKKWGTWVYVLTFISIFSFFFKKQLITIISLVLILLLSIIRDLTSPSFKRYSREKQGIPSKSEIRRMKNDNIRRIHESTEGKERAESTLDFSRNEFNERYA